LQTSVWLNQTESIGHWVDNKPPMIILKESLLSKPKPSDVFYFIFYYCFRLLTWTFLIETFVFLSWHRKLNSISFGLGWFGRPLISTFLIEMFFQFESETAIFAFVIEKSGKYVNFQKLYLFLPFKIQLQLSWLWLLKFLDNSSRKCFSLSLFILKLKDRLETENLATQLLREKRVQRPCWSMWDFFISWNLNKLLRLSFHWFLASKIQLQLSWLWLLKIFKDINIYSLVIIWLLWEVGFPGSFATSLSDSQVFFFQLHMFNI
jgi:hypothetical protein